MRVLPHPHDGLARQRRGVETRAAILRAAERIFAEEGLDGARTEAIAAAAGVNKALLYYYFRSKDDLFQSVIESHMKAFRDRALAVLGTSGPARAILLRYVSMQFDFVSGRPYYPRIFQRLMMMGSEELSRLAREYSAPLARAVTGLIERGIREGEFRPVDPLHTAISLASLINFYFSAARMVEILARLNPYDKRQLKRRKQVVLDFIRHGLFREPEGPFL